MFELHNPIFLLLFLLLPFYIWYSFRKKSTGMRFSSIKWIKDLPPSWKVRFWFIPLAVRGVALGLIIVGLARPRIGLEHTELPAEGVDIVLAIDVSTSMLAEDFTLNSHRANRLEVVKKVVKDFIKRRKNDRIGMVVFAAFAYTQCPLTLDYGMLLDLLDKVSIGMIEDGTAIGSGIAVSVNRLKELPGKSKIIILLTDGRNNMGKIDPITAAKLAKEYGIKVYTIGAGTRGLAPYPVKDMFGRTTYCRLPVDIDEDTLKEIARITRGMYFRATDTKSLEEIYRQIDKMEKVEVKVKVYREYKELFGYFVWPAVMLLLIELVVSTTLFRRVP